MRPNELMIPQYLHCMMRGCVIRGCVISERVSLENVLNDDMSKESVLLQGAYPEDVSLENIHYNTSSQRVFSTVSQKM